MRTGVWLRRFASFLLRVVCRLLFVAVVKFYEGSTVVTIQGIGVAQDWLHWLLSFFPSFPFLLLTRFDQLFLSSTNAHTHTQQIQQGTGKKQTGAAQNQTHTTSSPIVLLHLLQEQEKGKRKKETRIRIREGEICGYVGMCVDGAQYKSLVYSFHRWPLMTPNWRPTSEKRHKKRESCSRSSSQERPHPASLPRHENVPFKKERKGSLSFRSSSSMMAALLAPQLSSKRQATGRKRHASFFRHHLPPSL